MTARARTALPVRRLLASALADRLAGWHHERDLLFGRQGWIEPAPTGGRQSVREVRVDDIPGEPGYRVVEAYNGHERIVIRCTSGTEPFLVLKTLDDWQVLPPEPAGGRS